MSDLTRGQLSRRNIRETIEQNLSKYCPNTISKMGNLIAYDFDLAPDTVKYRYLFMFIDKGILIPVGNGIYDVSNSHKEKHLELVICASCKKDITQQVNSGQKYFKYHNQRFCTKTCYNRYFEQHEKRKKEDLIHE